MSLQLTAKHLAAHGRGPDTTLVHMAPREVASLQDLAQRHGGSLTTNPHTGLPEAGFLESLLPMALGAGAMMLPGMQGIGAGYIGLGIGALQGIRTGSLGKGVMAGLGAYGGASMAGGLLGSGAVAGDEAVKGQMAELQIQQADAANKALAGGARAQQAAAQRAAELTAQIQQQQAAALAKNTGDSFMGNLSSNLSTAGKGLTNGFSNFSNSVGMVPGSIGFKTALGAAAIPALMGGLEDNGSAPAQKTSDADRGVMANKGLQYYPNFAGPYQRNSSVGEYTYMRPYYGADGGAVGMADGGAVGMATGGTPRRNVYQEYMDYMNGASRNVQPVRRPPFRYAPQPIDAPLPAPSLPVEPPLGSSNMGSIGGGGGSQTAEQRAEREAAYNAPSNYLSINRYDSEATNRVNETENNEPGDRYAPAREIVKDEMSAAQLAALSPAERAMHMTDVRRINPLRTLALDVVENVGVVPLAKNVYEGLKYGDLGMRQPPEAPRAPVRDIQPGEITLSPTEEAKNSPPGRLGPNAGIGALPGGIGAPPSGVTSAGITSVAPVAPASAPVGDTISNSFSFGVSHFDKLTNKKISAEEAASRLANNRFDFVTTSNGENPPTQTFPTTQAQADAEAENRSLLSRYPAPVTDVPTVTSEMAPPKDEQKAINTSLFQQMIDAIKNPSEIGPVVPQNVTASLPGPVTDSPPTDTAPPAPPAPVAPAPEAALPAPPAPVAAPVAPAPVQMVNVTERWNGEDAPDPGQGWTRVNLGRGEVGYQRTVSREAGGGGDAAQDARIAAFDAMRSGADRNSVTPGGGSRDAGPATGDRGYGREGQHAAQGGLSTPYGFQHMARGGITSLPNPYNLGSYSDGGRLLKGPGDGVSDSIPATIGKGQPARLADGEFVIPARIVSEIGNGSTDAGARKLYAMMDRIQKGRRKTVGRGKVAVNSRADRYLPA